MGYQRRIEYKRYDHACPVCGRGFTTRQYNQRYCSAACKRAAARGGRQRSTDSFVVRRSAERSEIEAMRAALREGRSLR